jgi:crotonobetainyl-CoA:carnitine CoA-transferase CaiB-like acyl-CoA transferase
MSGVYDGLTAVELADRRNQWAGKLLADGGARVIQVEPVSGSPARWCGPFVNDQRDPDRCLEYWYYNTGKQSLALDIGRLPGQRVLRQLVAEADIFLESTKPGTLGAIGLDYESVSSNKGLIYASLTDFGQDGPWRDLEMNDHAHLALGGQMASSGYSDGTITPIGGHGNQAYHLGCALILQGITLALYNRLTTGLGQFIDVGIHDCCALCTEGAVPNWMYQGNTVYRQMGMHANARRQPDLELPTVDGKYVMAMTATFTDPNWARLVRWMQEKGVLGELGDEKYRDAATRALEYRPIVNAPEENYALRHYQDREFWRPVEHEEIGRSIPYPRGPWMSDQLGVEPRGRAPHLGEHSRELLASLGYHDGQIAALAATEVIR